VILIDCRVESAEDGERFGSDEQLDAASAPRLAPDETFALELDHHAVDAGRRDPKEALHVRLGGRERWIVE